MIIDKMDSNEKDYSDASPEELKESLINYICTENKAFFKSQQKDEAEIGFYERKCIAESVLNASHTRFLSRFGMNMRKEHLRYFEIQINSNSSIHGEEEKEMITEQIRSLSYNLDHQKTLVKNRRYAAMVELIQAKNYFDESEMKQRDPLLYEQLIVQHMSGQEKRACRRQNAQTLVDCLLEGMDYERDSKVEKEQRETEEQAVLNNDDDDDDSSNNSSCANHDDATTSDEESDHQQWGNFEDSSQATRPKKRSAATPFVTAGERDVLREEFIGIMYNRFLSGEDAEFFDYSQVDGNEAYDDTIENDQDCEDRYFDDEESQDAKEEKMEQEEKMQGNSDEEDDLDVYMRHLEENLKRQTKRASIEEFDDD